MAEVLISLHERTDVKGIRFCAPDGTSIELGEKYYPAIVKRKPSSKIKCEIIENASPLKKFLMELDPELERKRQGAWQTLKGDTFDRHIQAAHSMREVLREMLDTLAPKEKVKRAQWYRKPKQGASVTRSFRIRYAIVKDSLDISKSTLQWINALIDVVDTTYANLSAEGHKKRQVRMKLPKLALRHAKR